MASTARVQIDAFHSVDEVEHLNILAQDRVSIRDRITDHHLVAVSLVNRIRKLWAQRRQVQARGNNPVHFSRGIKADVRCLRDRRKQIAKLNAELQPIALAA